MGEMSSLKHPNLNNISAVCYGNSNSNLIKVVASKNRHRHRISQPAAMSDSTRRRDKATNAKIEETKTFETASKSLSHHLLKSVHSLGRFRQLEIQRQISD
jgi:hypothetical protein